jgi:uncharacterized protein YjbJ (UPF0337 family)
MSPMARFLQRSGRYSRQFAGGTAEGRLMDKDRIEGSVKEGAGKVEEEWGRAMDKPGTEADGEKRRVEGKVQKGWGETKDTVRDAVGKVKDDLEDNDA